MDMYMVLNTSSCLPYIQSYTTALHIIQTTTVRPGAALLARRINNLSKDYSGQKLEKAISRVRKREQEQESSSFDLNICSILYITQCVRQERMHDQCKLYKSQQIFDFSKRTDGTLPTNCNGRALYICMAIGCQADLILKYKVML